MDENNAYAEKPFRFIVPDLVIWTWEIYGIDKDNDPNLAVAIQARIEADWMDQIKQGITPTLEED